MELKLTHSKTEKNYEKNKYMFNLSENTFKNRLKSLNKRKHLKIKSLSNFETEYIQRLKYKISDNNSMTNTKKNFLFGNLKLNINLPLLPKNTIIMNKSKYTARKSFFLMRRQSLEEKMKKSKYEGKLENIYKENSLENKREEIENKMNKIKEIMEPLSSELSKTLKQIDSFKLDLELITKFKLTESNFKKMYFSKTKLNNNITKTNESSNLSNINKSIEKTKTKDIETLIKLEKMKLNQKRVDISQKLQNLLNKKDNIKIKLNKCEKNLTDLKEELTEIKDELIKHYHKLLSEGKDTRNEGLSWIIRAIWKLKTNVIMSYLPKFLDEKSIEFLFKYSDKLVEIERIQKIIQEKKDYLKKFGKKFQKISEKILKFDELKDKNNDNNEDEKNKNSESNENNFESPVRIQRKKTFKTPSMILLKNMRRRNTLMTELTPMGALKRLLSEPEIPENFKQHHKRMQLDNINESDSDIIQENSSSSKFDEETFKTSLYEPKQSFKKFNFYNETINKRRVTNNKIIQNLEMMLDNPNYLAQLTSHITPIKTIKISDYKNMNNYKLEEFYDSDLVKIFNEHKKLLLKINEKKNEAEKFVRKELDRIGKCFYVDDYSGKYNTNLKTVIGALIGEDNAKLEVFRQEREQKEYFKTIKNLRTFNLLNKKIY